MSIYRGRTAKEFYLTSALYDAIEDNNYSAVISMLQKGADPNIVLPKTEISPLHLAIGNDSEEFATNVTLLLLQHGGNPNVQNDEGLTPLHIAAAWGRAEIVKVLLSCGGDPELRDVSENNCIDYAIEHEHPNVVALLRNHTGDGFSFIPHNHHERTTFSLTLDKVVLDNGSTLAQYQVANDPTDREQKLNTLPKIVPNDYVREWCQSTYTLDKNITNHNASNYDPYISVSSSNPIVDSGDDFNNMHAGKLKRSHNIPIKHTNSNDCTRKESSKESGIVTLPDFSMDNAQSNSRNCEQYRTYSEIPVKSETSTYYTCNTSMGSSYAPNKNAFEITDDQFIENDRDNISEDSVLSKETTKDCSFTSVVSEVYKYTDVQEGIVLLEERFLLNQKCETDDMRQSQSSKVSSLPANFDYDTDVLRNNLKQYGCEPGPITKTTKRVYLKKLISLQTYPPTRPNQLAVKETVFSVELQRTLRNPVWFHDLSAYKRLEESLSKQFSHPDPSRRWREGTGKSSFTYLLLDPRITQNLPKRADSMTLAESWKTFLCSIFYVGKGKRSRPYSHLYEAVNLWQKEATVPTPLNKKLQRILNIWRDKHGVVCLHIFQNVIPVEAYTREAAMISALQLDNIENAKAGDFYGVAATWTSREKKMLGVYLLYKALLIFLNEGERHLYPENVN